MVGKKVWLSSRILNEEREIWIYTPPGYETDSLRCPVLYLLDGESHFQYVAGIVDYLSHDDRIPPMIVVAIPNTDRLRDLAPFRFVVNAHGQVDSSSVTASGGQNFLKFLREELVPYVDKNYRTQPYRILEGHSLGGMFATYILEEAPELFNSYIVMSAAFFFGGSYVVLENVGPFLDSHPNLRKSVFVSIGDEIPEIQKGVDSLVNKLKGHAPGSIQWRFKHYSSEDHGTVPPLSMYDGLRFIYSDWWINWDDTTRVNTADVMRTHYRMLSREFGYEILPSENLTFAIGYWLLRHHKIDDAIAVFNENVKRHPSSSDVYDSLGKAYMLKGDKESAITNYEKSIALNPNNENAKRMLSKLRENTK
jgi:predicted alpha/beta superfamily hydrolase